MSDEKKNIFSNSKLFQKIKGVKHLEIVAVIVLLAIALLVYFSVFSSGSKNDGKVVSTSSKTSISEYSSELESRLEGVLSKIKGAGNVSVMITFDGTPSYVYATDENQKTNQVSNKNTQTSTSQTSLTPIIVEVNGQKQPLICKEIMPQIKGVLIVSSGADDTSVKLELLKATQAVLDVPTTNIEILVGNKK